MIASNFNFLNKLNLDNLDYDSQFVIHSFLEKQDIAALKFVSTNLNYNLYRTFYTLFKNRVTRLFSNGLTPESLLTIATQTFGLKPPKPCHEMEWLNSVIIDNEKELFEKANCFINCSKVSKYDSFDSFPINKENFHLCKSNQPEYGLYKSNLSITLFSGEKRFYYLDRSLFQRGITPVNKTYLFTEISKNKCSIMGCFDSANKSRTSFQTENDDNLEGYTKLLINVQNRLTHLEADSFFYQNFNSFFKLHPSNGFLRAICVFAFCLIILEASSYKIGVNPETRPICFLIASGITVFSKYLDR